MANLAQIKADPSAYLGGGVTDEDAALYIEAVTSLIEKRHTESAACELVWNDGDWIGGLDRPFIVKVLAIFRRLGHRV